MSRHTCPVCFRLGDVINVMASLIGFVEGLIKDALAAIGFDIDEIVGSLLPDLFDPFPSPSWPSFELDFPDVDWREFGVGCFNDEASCINIPGIKLPLNGIDMPNVQCP